MEYNKFNYNYFAQIYIELFKILLDNGKRIWFTLSQRE